MQPVVQAPFNELLFSDSESSEESRTQTGPLPNPKTFLEQDEQYRPDGEKQNISSW